MICWTKEDRKSFVEQALTNFRWVPVAFIMLLVEETGACPYKIARLGFRHFDFEKQTVKIGLHTYPLSPTLLDLVKEQKSRLGFQAKAFPVFRQGKTSWTTLSKNEVEKDFLYIKRKLNLRLDIGVGTLRLSVFRDRVNEGQLPTQVAKDMHLSLKEAEYFWRYSLKCAN
jgi:integrase